MKIVFNDDFPVAIGTHGIETSIPFDQARLVDGEIVDVSQFTKFFIDKGGRKHAVDLAGYQSLSCNIDDELVFEDGAWRIKTPLDFYQDSHSEVEKRRQIEYTSRVRPYLEEAEIKKHMGDQSEYIRLMDLAVQEREKIQTENPWPTPPEV
ncbi:hypothetical protein BCU40_022130 [Vibrio lentus]|uniref:hypothetical protein n=1 Tax=Vibrio lentus TaxID=136468 RepID=UPI000C82ED23|nr:hypothetical protein [Vibrio lentus]PMI63317.1 hypothetical protein BCU40_21615 [Vibrio lentus]